MVGLTEELKKYLQELGAAMVGIAPVERYHEAPEGHRPKDYLPGVKSIITFAYKLNNGAVDNLPVTRNQYMQEFDFANSTLLSIAHKGARYLEEKGFPAIAFGPEASIGDYSRLKGDFSHKHSAVLCGLGVFGIHDLLVTPKYRSRIRLASIMTEAELDSDDIAENRDCEKCQKCVKICPSGALSGWKDKYTPDKGWVIDKEKCAHYIFVVNGSKRCGMCVKACTG